MTLFQWIVIPLLLLVMIATGVAVTRSLLARGWGLAWMMLWAAASIAVAFPTVLGFLANALGIGRGTDLLLYASILVMFVGFFLMYLRYRRVTEQLTAIIRHIAISEALSEREGGSASLSEKGSFESERPGPAIR